MKLTPLVPWLLFILGLSLACAGVSADVRQFTNIADRQLSHYRSGAAVTADNCAAFEAGAVALEEGPDTLRGPRADRIPAAVVAMHRRALDCVALLDKSLTAGQWLRFRAASVQIWTARRQLVSGEGGG